MDRKNGYTNNKTQNIYFTMHKQIVEAPELEKGPNFGGNGGHKYKIFNFEANLSFGML